MIKMTHAITGVEMWVADDKVDEFKKRGHKEAPLSLKPEKATSEEMKAVKAEAVRRKTARKK